jgi:uncharacterized protein DUF3574
MRVLNAGLVSAFTVGLFSGMALLTRGDVKPVARDPECGTASSAQLRTTLYFGLGRPNGTVNELEWQMFLRDEVTARFPAGLTVWDAQGQWRQSAGGIGHERTKVLLLVHPDTAPAREAVQKVIARYRKAFEQESVLWETARVCAAA